MLYHFFVTLDSMDGAEPRNSLLIRESLKGLMGAGIRGVLVRQSPGVFYTVKVETIHDRVQQEQGVISLSKVRGVYFLRGMRVGFVLGLLLYAFWMAR